MILGYQIKIPVEFKPPRYDNLSTWITNKFSCDDVNPELVSWLNDRGVSFKDGLFFNVPPGMKHNLHIDMKYGSHYTDCVKINFIYNSNNAVMKWYKLNEGKGPTLHKNSRGDTIIGFKPEDCHEVFELSGDYESIIFNGQEIHTMINGDTMRQCYSLFLLKSNTDVRVTWDEAQYIFKDCIIK
jgi:hypothetical protein